MSGYSPCKACGKKTPWSDGLCNQCFTAFLNFTKAKKLPAKMVLNPRFSVDLLDLTDAATTVLLDEWLEKRPV